MIYAISKKEYDKQIELRKLSETWTTGIAFKAVDDRYYMTTTRGLEGGREIYEFNRQKRAARKQQQRLLELENYV